MKIFVTGGSGFLGGHVLNRLAGMTDTDVFALYRSKKAELNGLEQIPNWVEGDLCGDYSKQLGQCDVLLHMAAYGVKDLGNWDVCFEVNVKQSLELWRQAVACGVRHFVVVGSCFEYGASGENFKAIPVEAALAPTQAYHASKAAATMAAIGLGYAEKCFMTVLRPFHLFGENEPEGRFYPELVKSARLGQDFPMTAGEQIRDFTPVEVAADVVVKNVISILLEKTWRPPLIANIGTGCPRSLRHFAEDIWEKERASGRLLFGCRKYREAEVMRYVPKV